MGAGAQRPPIRILWQFSGYHKAYKKGKRIKHFILGRFWRGRGPSWMQLNGVLEASWVFLGRKRWPTWLQVGSQNGAKINQKSFQKSIIFLMPLGIDFWLDFDGFFVPKWSQIGVKMGSKIDVNFERPILQKYI